MNFYIENLSWGNILYTENILREGFLYRKPSEGLFSMGDDFPYETGRDGVINPHNYNFNQF